MHLFDITYLLGSQGLRGAAFTVAAIYRSGMVEYDQQLAFVSLTEAQRLFDKPQAPANAILKLKSLGRPRARCRSQQASAATRNPATGLKTRLRLNV